VTISTGGTFHLYDPAYDNKVILFETGAMW
jgi:hypothetical protein